MRACSAEMTRLEGGARAARGSHIEHVSASHESQMQLLSAAPLAHCVSVHGLLVSPTA